MRKPVKLIRVSEAEYLASEEHSQTRHEFVDGYVFAMSGGTQAHNLICTNIAAFLHTRLRGKGCRASVNDLKVKIESARSFYYPDVIVDCAEFNPRGLFAIRPTLIVEVLSPSTASIDRREKLMAYQKLASLKEYLIVYQDRQHVDLYRKDADEEWLSFILHADDELVLESLPGGATPLPFATIYDGYDAPRRVKEEESDYSLFES
jgi:Uma2 family endonuclease